MGVKSRVGPRVQIERSPKNDVLALVLHAAVPCAVVADVLLLLVHLAFPTG
jgi:hypothetical protein